MKIEIVWNLSIRSALCPKIYNRGGFCINQNDDLVLGCNIEDQYNFHKNGEIIIISNQKMNKIFETRGSLWAPILDENEFIYFATHNLVKGHHKGNDKSTLLSINYDGDVRWKYPLAGHAESLPVIYQDTIYIFDFIKEQRSGRLSKIANNGELIWEKPFNAFIWFEPLLLGNNNRMILGFRFYNQMYLMDLEGNILKALNENNAGTITFSQTKTNNIYGCLHGCVVSLNENLDYLWEYKPLYGHIDFAPVADSGGNLYTFFAKKLLSLDNKGKERWSSQTSGIIGFQPLILNNDYILMATSAFSDNNNENTYSTFLEIFSNIGDKVLEYKIPGVMFHALTNNNDALFVITNCEKNVAIKERTEKTIKIFSFRIL
jgi:hypothetical protein